MPSVSDLSRVFLSSDLLIGEENSIGELPSVKETGLDHF